MKPSDVTAVGEFLDWTGQLYGESVRQHCQERISELREDDQDFDPTEVVSDAYVFDRSETVEGVAKMSATAFEGRLHLKPLESNG